MEKNKKSIMYNILIVGLILLIIAIAAIGINAWAKYSTADNGTATAQVAKWSFKIVDGIAETSEVIDFAVTRTDENTSVAEGKLAPGTYGQLEIGIDARGTETILEYVIDLALTNKPTNMKFYSDSAKTQEIEIVDGKLVRTGFMSLEDVEEIRTETIYWDWPYVTGETAAEQDANDDIDTADAGKTMTMAIVVTGTEVLEAPIYLADVVQVGDYVNYDASSNGTKTFTSSDCLTGTSVSATISTDDSFNSSAKAQWRVLSVDKTKGIVELMSTDPTAQTVTLSGGDGFVNAETVLNKVGAIYGQGKGATGGRSIAVEDINQYSSYLPSIRRATYTSGNFYKEIKDESGNVTGYETTKTVASSSNPIIMTNTYYDYSVSRYFSNSRLYDMICSNSTSNNYKTVYWLASRCVELETGVCYFKVNKVEKRQRRS